MNDEYRRMQKEVEEHRKQRVAQGLSAEKPPRPRGIVGDYEARALLARCKPLVEFLSAYVRICNKSNIIADITPEQDALLDSFDETLTLLEYTDDRTAFVEMLKGKSIRKLVSVIRNRSKYEDVNEYITTLLINLKFILEEKHRYNRDDTIDEQKYTTLLKELEERKEEFKVWADS